MKLYEYIIVCCDNYRAWHTDPPKIIIGKKSFIDIEDEILKLAIYNFIGIINTNLEKRICGYTLEIGKFEYGFYLEPDMIAAKEYKAKFIYNQVHEQSWDYDSNNL